MHPQTSSLTSTGLSPAPNGHAKCRHFTATGRQCRLRALQSGLCFRHAALLAQPPQPTDVDLSADFIGHLDDLKSAERINEFLAKLLVLVVQNRISPRRAAVLTYITNQLLHSLVALQRDHDLQLNWDGFPCPDFLGNRDAEAAQSELDPHPDKDAKTP